MTANTDNFKTVYRILNFLKISEQYDEFDREHFTREYFDLTERQWAMTLVRMIDDGHVKGISIAFGADGHSMVSLSIPMITSKGLEHLEENSFMRKAARLAKGIREILP